MKCFGRNDTGHNGYADTDEYGSGAPGRETPADRGWLDFGAKVVQIAGQQYQSIGESICALTETSEIYCWGDGSLGALGNKSTANIGDDELATDIAPVAVWGPVQAAPGSIRPSNLKAWFDAADSSTVSTGVCGSATSTPSDGGSVRCWKDKSGNGNNHIAQTTTSEIGLPITKMLFTAKAGFGLIVSTTSWTRVS